MLRPVLALLTTLFFLQTANAGPVVDYAKKAEEQALAGNAVQALKTLKEAQWEMWKTFDFTTRKTEFVSHKASGFGVYNVRKQGGNYPLNSTIRVYIEPIGVGWERTPGKATLRITTDLNVFNASGKKIFAKKAFGKFTISAKEWTPNFFLNLSLKTTGLKPGNYRIQFVLNDLVTGKKQAVNYDIIIHPPA